MFDLYFKNMRKNSLRFCVSEERVFFERQFSPRQRDNVKCIPHF